MDKIKWVAVLLVLVLLGAYVVQNDSKVTDSAEPIKIGAALGLTGDGAIWGEMSQKGAQLAVDEINKKGGVDGRQLQLVVEDTKSTAKDTVSAVSKLKNFDKADAFLVTWLDVYQGAESLVSEGNIMISPDAGIEAVNGVSVHPGVFSAWYRTEAKSDLAVKHMSEHGIKKLYIIAQNDSYYATAVQFMESSAKKYGVQIVGTEMLNAGADIKTTLTKIGAEKPDAVFFAFYDEQINSEFLKRRTAYLGTSVAIYGDEFVQQNYARDAMAGLFESIYFYAPQKQEKAFLSAFKGRYGTDPVFGASTSYDAVYMLAKAFADKPQNVDEYMRSTKFKTVSYGEVTFDALGGISTKNNYFTIQKITNGVASPAN